MSSSSPLNCDEVSWQCGTWSVSHVLSALAVTIYHTCQRGNFKTTLTMMVTVWSVFQVSTAQLHLKPP